MSAKKSQALSVVDKNYTQLTTDFEKTVICALLLRSRGVGGGNRRRKMWRSHVTEGYSMPSSTPPRS
jgi:hypothetical protein